MDNNEINILLTKYREKRCSEQELDFLHQWYEDRDIQIITKLSDSEFRADLIEIADGLPLRHAVIKRKLWPRIASAAAAAVILGVFLMFYLQSPILQKPLFQKPLITLKTMPTEKQQLILADGSEIWINAGSKLEYPERFTGKTREVYLSGEAYFDVKHDPSKPFIIHTGRVITTVLGTAFNIKEDTQLHQITVTVTRGKVSVANGSEKLGVITPNQQISFNVSNNGYVQQNVDAQKVIAWQEKDLRFNDLTFEQAAIKLELRFKVKIEFSNENLRSCKFTGTALNGEKLDQILSVICTFNHATYSVRKDGSILIEGTGCN